MNLRRLRIWEWITGLAGAALLVSLFLDWYDADGLGPVSGWEAFSVLDVLLAIAALMGIAVAVMAAAHDSPAVSLAIASLLLLVGSIVTIALVVRVISGPEVVVHGVTAPDDDVTRAIGLWVGLAAASLTTLGALGSMRDERFPRGARIEVPVETLPPPEGGKA